MGDPTQDTAREAEVRDFLGRISTAQSAALTSARGAIDRMAAQATALQAKIVDDETFSELESDVGVIVKSATDAQGAFDQIGIVSPPTP